MKKVCVFIIYMCAFLTQGFAQDNSDSLKSQADSAYVKEDYLGAAELYEQILATEGEAAEIYYNLGNSYFKADKMARAILNYERALLLDPGSTDIRFNLELARSKTVDKENEISQVFFVIWFKAVTNLMNEAGWAKVAIIAFLILLGGVAAYIFSKTLLVRKVGFVVAACMLVVCVAANVFASVQKSKLQHRVNAIVVSASLTVRSTPNESGTELFVLHEGRKVSIKDDTMKEWKEIQLEDGNAGWVPVSAIEII